MEEQEQSGSAPPPPPPPPPPAMSPRGRGRRRSRSPRSRRTTVSGSPPPLETRVTFSTDYDAAYFKCYGHLGVHEEMIKDNVRTEAYKKAIAHHRQFIKGKVVLDVGCGTGILSIFCAREGARRVYAVEASNIAMQAKMVVESNNISNIITVLHGRVEDVEIEERVDVIISEWMGYMLLHESMLESVIIARNRWLKPGGLMLPSHTKLYMAPITNTNRYCDSIDFWHDVHGIDMSAMIPFAKQCEFEEPCLETIKRENVLASPHVVKDINCYSVTSSDIKSVTSRFTFNSMINAPLHGFAFWFDAEFIENVISPLPIRYQLPTSVADNLLVCGSPRETEVNLNKALLLSTAPEDPPTHWQQTLIYLYNPMELEKDQLIEGSVTLSQSQEHARSINVRLQYTVAGQSFVKMAVMK